MAEVAVDKSTGNVDVKRVVSAQDQGVTVNPDGSRQQVYDRLLNPMDNLGDRGFQRIALEVEVAEGSELLFETGPGPRGNYTRDWASWGPITIK